MSVLIRRSRAGSTPSSRAAWSTITSITWQGSGLAPPRYWALVMVLVKAPVTVAWIAGVRYTPASPPSPVTVAPKLRSDV